MGYLVAEDEGHGFRGRENRLAVSVAIEGFLGEHLGGRVQQDVPDDIARTLEALTVDVNTVEVPDMDALATTDLPRGDGSALEPAEMEYALNLKVMEQ